jgi:hypothetical protein
MAMLEIKGKQNLAEIISPIAERGRAKLDAGPAR